jgi:putative ABC transport system permease protein
MRIFLAIAWRNIMRNKKRSFITAFAIAVGLTALIFMWSLFDGVYPMLVNNMTSMFMGHMQASNPAYVEKPLMENAVVDGEPVLKAIADDKDIAAYSPRLTTFGLVSYGDNSQGAAITGVDPELENKFGKIDEFVGKGGSFLEGKDRNGAVIGATLAKNIDAGLGDEILIVTSNRFNNLSYLGPLPIVGVIDSGVPEFDSATVFVDRQLLAREIFVDTSVVFTNPAAEITDTSGIFTSVGIMVRDQHKLEQVRDELQKLMPANVKLRTWSEMNPWIQQALDIDVAFGYIILAIVLIIVVAGILNTVLMSVMERTREFGIMRALGTKGRQIFLTVSLESVLLGLLGLAIGAFFGVSLTLLFGQIGLDIYGSVDRSLMGQFYILDTVVYPRLALDHFITTCVLIMAAVVLVSLYPARKAAKMEPVAAIKSLG